MAWTHKTVIKEYEMDDKNQQDDVENVEKFRRTDTHTSDAIVSDIASSPTTNSQMSDP